MFIAGTQSGYNRNDEQFCSGYFMIWGAAHLPTGSTADPRFFDAHAAHATVRKVRMTPCGNFMCAKAVIGKRLIPLSGSLGGDGLPCHWWADRFGDPEVMKSWLKNYFEPVPASVYALWASQNGHNTVNDATGGIAAYGRDLYQRIYNLKNPVKVFYGHKARPRQQGPLHPVPGYYSP